MNPSFPLPTVFVLDLVVAVFIGVRLLNPLDDAVGDVHAVFLEFVHGEVDIFVFVAEEGLDEHVVESDALLLHEARVLSDLFCLARFHEALDHAAVGDEVMPVAVCSHLGEELFGELEVAALVGGVD